MQSTNRQNAIAEVELLSFDVPLFSGETIEEGEFIEEIEIMYASIAVTSYITDALTCDADRSGLVEWWYSLSINNYSFIFPNDAFLTYRI